LQDKPQDVILCHSRLSVLLCQTPYRAERNSPNVLRAPHLPHPAGPHARYPQPLRDRRPAPLQEARARIGRLLDRTVNATGERITRTNVNELVYLLRFKDRQACEAAWAAFRQDPEWLETRRRTEASGPIVQEVISQMLTPTAFSPMS